MAGGLFLWIVLYAVSIQDLRKISGIFRCRSCRQERFIYSESPGRRPAAKAPARNDRWTLDRPDGMSTKLSLAVCFHMTDGFHVSRCYARRS